MFFSLLILFLFQHRGRYAHSRVSSAVPDSTERRPLREQTVIVDQFSRPNTTHTFRVGFWVIQETRPDCERQGKTLFRKPPLPPAS